jgi:branched-chain amino acid transport system ATP-binding protein
MTIDVKNLSKRYEGIAAVCDLSFTARENEILSLIGPNGAGKTTVLNLITGFHQVDSGNVIFNGEDITGLKPHRIANIGISRTFQLPRIFPRLTVEENTLLAAKYMVCEKFLYSIFRTRRFKKEFRLMRDEAGELLNNVELYNVRESLAGNLSFGQQKLLEIARILMRKPKALLLDEPVAGVNPVLVNAIEKLIYKEREKGNAIVIIEHNIEFVMRMSDHIVVVNGGRKIAEGKPDDIRRNEEVVRAYLGKRFTKNAVTDQKSESSLCKDRCVEGYRS